MYLSQLKNRGTILRSAVLLRKLDLEIFLIFVYKLAEKILKYFLCVIVIEIRKVKLYDFS
jgi:hypothetical protein